MHLIQYTCTQSLKSNTLHIYYKLILVWFLSTMAAHFFKLCLISMFVWVLCSFVLWLRTVGGEERTFLREMHWSAQEAGRWRGITLKGITNLCLLVILWKCLLFSFVCFLFSSYHFSPTDFLLDPLKIEIHFCVCFLKHKSALLYNKQADLCHRAPKAYHKQVKRTWNKHKILNQKRFCYSKQKFTPHCSIPYSVNNPNPCLCFQGCPAAKTVA